MNPHVDFHALAPELILSATILVVLIADLFFGPSARGSRARRSRRSACSPRSIPVITLAADGTDRVAVRRRVRGRPLRARAPGLLPRRRVRHAADVGRLHRRRRLLPGRVLRPAAHVGARHDGDGVGARPHHDLRGAGDDLHPDVRARGLAQARPEVERSGDQVLPHRRAVVGDHALRHVARVRATGVDAARRHRAPHRACTARTHAAGRRHLPDHRRVRVQGRARCRSTSGRPTPTRVRPPRSPRSSRSRPRPAGSSPCSTIIFFGFFPSQDTWQPVLWILAAASIIFGNLVALRQTNIVRMLAYSSIAQGGFILVPFAVAADGDARALVVRGRRHLPPHLRRDEPRRVRGASSRSPAAPARPRSRPTAGSGTYAPGLAVADDDLPVLARRASRRSRAGSPSS